MCITVNKAALSATKILSLPLENGRHFIAYSNKVENKSGKPNAMILPIPGATKPEWFHNTEAYKGFLDEITEKAQWNENWLGRESRSKGLKGTLGFDRFELGMYTIGLASSFEGAEEFIASLPKEKRPEISDELRKFFRENNGGWSFAVCCFDSENTISSQPIAFEYVPFNADLLYFPTLDAHDGGAPDTTKMVDADHAFIFEHTGAFENRVEVDAWGRASARYAMEFLRLGVNVPDFLNKRRYRFHERGGNVINGDTYIRVSEINEIDFSVLPNVYRAAPKSYSEEGATA